MDEKCVAGGISYPDLLQEDDACGQLRAANILIIIEIVIYSLIIIISSLWYRSWKQDEPSPATCPDCMKETYGCVDREPRGVKCIQIFLFLAGVLGIIGSILGLVSAKEQGFVLGWVGIGLPILALGLKIAYAKET